MSDNPIHPSYALNWSGQSSSCSIPDCSSTSIVTPVFGLMHVYAQGRSGRRQADLPVYAFNGDTYSGISATGDSNGEADLWLPAGDYRFRIDEFGLQFWSDPQESCTVPGCQDITVQVLGLYSAQQANDINYVYDPLNRLKEANYYQTTDNSDDNERYFHYEYDPVGNRLMQRAKAGNDAEEVINSYSYDIANRLISVDGVDYTWDNNGNLLNDGQKTYSYDDDNRLVGITQGGDSYSFAYNGQGDRLVENNEQFVLDLNAGLSQVLQDGTNSYIYGSGRIAEKTDDKTAYFLSDALGSARQMAGEDQKLILSQSYDPYGELLASSGDAATPYGFTGEMQDNATGLVNLRARNYDPSLGRFISQDTWSGIDSQSSSQNGWLYGYDNPIRYLDPGGLCGRDKKWWFFPDPDKTQKCIDLAQTLEKTYGITIYWPNREDWPNKGEKSTISSFCQCDDCQKPGLKGLGNKFGSDQRFMLWTYDELQSLASSLGMYDSEIVNSQTIGSILTGTYFVRAEHTPYNFGDPLAETFNEGRLGLLFNGNRKMIALYSYKEQNPDMNEWAFTHEFAHAYFKVVGGGVITNFTDYKNNVIKPDFIHNNSLNKFNEEVYPNKYIEESDLTHADEEDLADSVTMFLWDKHSNKGYDQINQYHRKQATLGLRARFIGNNIFN